MNKNHRAKNAVAKSSKHESATLPIKRFRDQNEWTRWLGANHRSSKGVWVSIAKNASGAASVSYREALEAALCYGWIDGQKQKCDDSWWLQKFTPRGKRSIWSKINRGKAELLMKNGRMRAPGLKAVDAARKDGRWDSAYASQKTVVVPRDLEAALRKSPKAKSFFTTLNSVNRYAILFRIQTAKKPETRERRISKFIAMLERNELIHT